MVRCAYMHWFPVEKKGEQALLFFSTMQHSTNQHKYYIFIRPLHCGESSTKDKNVLKNRNNMLLGTNVPIGTCLQPAEEIKVALPAIVIGYIFFSFIKRNISYEVFYMYNNLNQVRTRKTWKCFVQKNLILAEGCYSECEKFCTYRLMKIHFCLL